MSGRIKKLYGTKIRLPGGYSNLVAG